MVLTRNGTRGRTRGARLRKGALLLDLFIATALFATCILVLGNYGSQSLQLAQINAIERLGLLTAESILAKEVTLGGADGERTWQESVQGTNMDVSVVRTSLKSSGLQSITVQVSARSGTKTRRPSVSISRLVMRFEGS